MAMDSTASLLFRIGADPSNAAENIGRFRNLFNQNVSSMKTQFHNWAAGVFGDGEHVIASFKTLATVGLGMGAGLATSLFAAATKTAELGEKIHLLSQSTGVAASQLSGLHYAAGIMGVDFHVMTRSVQQLDRGLSPFAATSAMASKALASLGLSAYDAHGKLLPNTTLLANIADKFHAMKDGAEKTAVAMALFGRAGAEMIPILNRGGAALRNSTEEARKLGVYFNSASAAQSAQFLESMRQLKAAMEGFAVTVGKDVIPLLTKGFNKAAVGATAVIKDFKLTLNWFAEHSPDIVKGIEAITAVIITYTIRAGLARLATLDFAGALSIDAIISALTVGLEGLVTMVTEFAVAIKGAIMEMGPEVALLTAAAIAIYKMVDAYRQMHAAEVGAKKAAEEYKQTLAKATVIATRYANAVSEITGKQIVAKNEIERENIARQQAAHFTAAQRIELQKLMGTYQQVSTVTGTGSWDQKQKEWNDKMGQSLRDLQATIQAEAESTDTAEQKVRVAFAKRKDAVDKVLAADKRALAEGKITLQQYDRAEQEHAKYIELLEKRLSQQLENIQRQREAKLRKAHQAADAAALKLEQQQSKSLIAVWYEQTVAQSKALIARQAAVNKATQQLDAMAQKSSTAAETASQRIVSAYQRQILAIRQLVMAEQQKGVTQAQAAQLARAEALAVQSAAAQEQTAMVRLEQQQLKSQATTMNSFLQMGLAAAGFKNVMVKAMMQVIKALESELIAHMATAAGATAAENTKNVAVGKGIGLRSTWRALENFAEGLADLASFNFSGAAQHFAASAAFTTVAAQVGASIAGMMSGGGAGAGSRGRRASAGSSRKASSLTKAKSGNSAAAPVVNVHIDGVISSDNLASVMDQVNGLVTNGQANLAASHVIVNGALVPAGTGATA